ncbi:hypothetical protein AB3R30_17160 [Leptolyngbyaceae cyanobacterium UHCC 1019]
MTHNNENGNRLDRIEAIMLDLAAGSVRHDNAINRHDEEFSRINTTLERMAAGQELNRQDINTLTASIQDLRNLVADYIQERS